ncbi:MAG TPA: serine/threonine-protein kinase [Tepidisphaeraceae bacterium]|jgi:serine/threonine-protein kinase
MTQQPTPSNFDTPATAVAANIDTEVGRLVLDSGLATRAELEFCREHQKQASDPNQRSLADLLVDHGFVTANQVKRVRRQMEERRTSQIPGYTLLGRLGKGAMATVYKARQISLQRDVAIKVLPKKSSESAEFVERFYKEGRAAARLSHNNIVQAIDVGSTPDNFHYFVMEYIEGRTLYDVMQPPPVGEGRNFTEAEALDIGIQMADALGHAHQKGLIHRDVKPKNIILTSHNVAKLTDLGLAREADDKQAAESEAGKAYGTPYYISPEQIRGDLDIDARADIYSLGATLYHMVVGRAPFDGDSPSAVMHKHLREPLVPPDHINTDLSGGFSEIIEVCMAKNRDERYQNTADLLEDLLLVKGGQAPKHARRQVDLDAVATLQEHGQTLDLDAPMLSIWNNTTVVTIAVVAGISVFINVVAIALFLASQK